MIPISKNIIASILLALWAIQTIMPSALFAMDNDTWQAVHSIDELLGAQPRAPQKHDTDDISSLLREHDSYFPHAIESEAPKHVLDIAGDIFRRSTGAAENSGALFGSGTKVRKIRTAGEKRETKHLAGISGTIGVQIASGTTIRASDGTMIDPSQIGLTDAPASIQSQAETFHKNHRKTKDKSGKLIPNTTSFSETFDFGIAGTHLLFSEPVAITINTPNFTDGIIVDLATMHAGESAFNTSGLSIDPSTSCNTDGTSSKPGSQAIVKNGKITFYTCGASSFTLNPVGGIAGSNDLKFIIGDYGQVQLYSNGLAQIYGGNPPSTGSGGPSSWPRLRVGAADIGNGGTIPWTSASTVGSQTNNTYIATTTLMYTTGSLTYILSLNWNYTAPNKYITWTYNLIVPTGNTANVRLYFAMDSMVGGDDANDVGYYSTTPSQTIGAYDNVTNILSAQRYVSGRAWSGYIANPQTVVLSQISAGNNLSNAVSSTAWDQAYGMNWDFGATAGTYTATTEWRLVPYVTWAVPDLVPGIAQPEGPLAVNTLSQIPMTVTNGGNASSSGVHTLVLSLPNGITGPSSVFTNNGWACGAVVSSTVTCNQNTQIASLSGDIVRVPVTPTGATQGQTLTFTGTFSGGGDSNLTNNSSTVQLQVAIAATPTANPGGVAWSYLWLKADSLALTDGAAVSSWTNNGIVPTNATQTTAASQPIFQKQTATNLVNNVNFNPVVSFNGTSQYLQVVGGLLGNKYHSNATIYTVAIQKNYTTANFFVYEPAVSTAGGARLSAHLPWGDGTIYWDSGDTNSSRISVAWWALQNMPYIWSLTKNTNGTPNGNKSNIRRNGWGLVAGTNTVGFTGSNSNFYLGSSAGTSNFYAGSIAEVIVTFGTGTTTAAQQARIESYLAIKYGITLDQVAATQNYVLSNDSIIWNASTMGTFNNNIAGIARDDASGLAQYKSQSIINTNDIIVATQATPVSNYAALTWANDGGIFTAFNATDTLAGYTRLIRKWKIEENNTDVGQVTVSYPASVLPTAFTGTLYMLVSSSSTGSLAASTVGIPGTYNSTTANWDFSANLADGNYLSFAMKTTKILPGGVTGGAWYRADAGTSCSTAGCTVSSWIDQTGNGHLATQTTAAAQPIYAAKALNFNPVLTFDGTKFFYTSWALVEKTAFIVGKRNSSTNTFWEVGAGYNRWVSWGIFGAALDEYSTYTRNGGITTDALGTYNLITATGGVTTNTVAPNIGYGTPSFTSLNGGIAEILIYTGALTATQQNQVESYLAIKYGITMDQAVPDNYVLSNGTIVWNAASMGTFTKNIAGIARDDSSWLMQYKSQSIDNTGDILVSISSIAADMSALMWSNDGSATGTFSPTDTVSGYQRIARRWKIEENPPDIGTITVSYPAAALPTSFTGTLYMLVSSSSTGSFATNTTNIAGTYSSSTATWDFPINLADGNYLSFAIKLNTVPPVITSVSFASWSLLPTGTFSYTVGYSSTGSTINTASFSQKIYAWDSTGATWSTTNIAPTYVTGATANTSTGTFQVQWLPFGKYRFDISISNIGGNTTSTGRTYYIDALTWNVSTPVYDIGNIANNTKQFGTGELVVTVQTVGAGFRVTMISPNTLAQWTETINFYNGTAGWGYDQWNGTAYSTNITSPDINNVIANQAATLNTNGQLNTYTYKIKYGALVSGAMAGKYQGSLNFWLTATY